MNEWTCRSGWNDVCWACFWCSPAGEGGGHSARGPFSTCLAAVQVSADDAPELTLERNSALPLPPRSFLLGEGAQSREKCQEETGHFPKAPRSGRGGER